MVSGCERRWVKYLAGRSFTESRGLGGPMSSGRSLSCWERICGRGEEWSCSSVRSTLDAPNPQKDKDLKKLRMEEIMNWNVSL